MNTLSQYKQICSRLSVTLPHVFDENGNIIGEPMEIPSFKLHETPTYGEWGRFEAGGKVWHIETPLHLSVRRLTYFNKYNLQAQYGMTSEQMIAAHTGMFNYLESKASDQLSRGALVAKFMQYSYDMVKGLQDLEYNEEAYMRCCAVFINETGEDRTTFSDDLAKQKIEEWNKAYESNKSLSAAFFLSIYENLVTSLESGLTDFYRTFWGMKKQLILKTIIGEKTL